MQLSLDIKKLKEIGFTEKKIPADDMNPAKTTYRIKCLNGHFYYNPDEDRHKWYQAIEIGEHANHICLDIQRTATLFAVLSAFNVDYNFDII